jgi:hypothetical protein
MRIKFFLVFAATTLAGALAAPARAELTPQELAKLAQNPVGNLVSVPFQNNSNFGFGPENGTQNILNIQPVIPFHAGTEWNIITRTIFPIVWLPAPSPTGSGVSGLGDMQLSGFLSPAEPKGIIWGAGTILQIPTHTSPALGNDNWGLGPTFVVLRLEKGNPWVYGVLLNNVWSLGSGSSPSYNNGLIQWFVNYNIPGGTYLTSAPVNTVNWKAASGQMWTVPLGAGVGRIFHLGKLPLNTQISGYYNVVRPDYTANWQLRLQVQFMFPK